MKTIKSLKDITTLEVGDKVVFGDLEYTVTQGEYFKRYYLVLSHSFEKLGIKTAAGRFPEVYSLEALTAIVSALFKEYEKQQNVLPKTWDEFCEKHKVKEGECYIDSLSNIQKYQSTSLRGLFSDKNICTSESEAKAFIALMQLRQLRKAYIKEWEPDWTKDTEIKYCIDFYHNQIRIANWGVTSRVLSFPTEDLANQFLTNFKDLLKIAKPLL